MLRATSSPRGRTGQRVPHDRRAVWADHDVYHQRHSFAAQCDRHARALKPPVVVHAGRVIERNLRRERMTEEDLAEEARLQKIASLDEIEWAVLEPSGHISVIKKQA
jgi:Protein of unknown function (DUF421)